VTVILSVLGISFLLMAETENRIARNEKRNAQVLYAAEAGVRAVEHWFDRPDTGIAMPGPGVVDRTVRLILDETDPYDPGAALPADGVLGSRPFWKQAVDLDVDGADDLFERPYHPTPLNALMGTADGPDLRIDDGDPAAEAFLADLSQTLFGNLPGEGGGVTVRLSRIDVRAPPYLELGGSWERFGLATVEVTARLYRDPDGDREVLGERTVRAVLTEIDYRRPSGPVSSCGDLSFVPRTGEPFPVRWGTLVAVGTARLGTPTALPRSVPRALPATPGTDPLWTTNAVAFGNWLQAIDVDPPGLNVPIDDPWLRVLAGGAVAGAPAGPQPFPSAVPPVAPDLSQVMQDQAVVVCPAFDYDVWKRVYAQSGKRGVHYFEHAGGGLYRENGVDPAQSFGVIANGAEGLYFFDTDDGLPPEDTDGDGRFDNLTPPILVSGGWSFRGVLFLNAESIRIDSTVAPQMEVEPPGEPYSDADTDGEHDAGEPWVNLRYPTTAAAIGNAVTSDLADGPPERDGRGPAIPDVPIALAGILFTNGTFEATGRGTVYGAIVAREAVTQDPADGSADAPRVLWDSRIADAWPPENLGLPRVAVTEWDTGD